MKALRNPFFLGLGWFCVGLGALGIALPFLPTTPFLLVAVWAFSKSSPELAERIRNHRLAGPFVRDWQDEGIIPPGAKVLAMVMMASSLAYIALGSGAPAWVVWGWALVVAGAATFILTRPGRRRED